MIHLIDWKLSKGSIPSTGLSKKITKIHNTSARNKIVNYTTKIRYSLAFTKSKKYELQKGAQLNISFASILSPIQLKKKPLSSSLSQDNFLKFKAIQGYNLYLY